MLRNTLPWLFHLLQIFDPKLPLASHDGAYVRIGNVSVRIGGVHVRKSDVHGHTSDVHFRIRRDDVRIHHWQAHDHAEAA